MGVLAQKQRLEAALLERARQLADVDAVIGRKIEGAHPHDDASADFRSSARSRRTDSSAASRLGAPAFRPNMPSAVSMVSR